MSLSRFHIIMDLNGSMIVSSTMSKLESTVGGVVTRIRLSLTRLSAKMPRSDSLLTLPTWNEVLSILASLVSCHLFIFHLYALSSYLMETTKQRDGNWEGRAYIHIDSTVLIHLSILHSSSSKVVGPNYYTHPLTRENGSSSKTWHNAGFQVITNRPPSLRLCSGTSVV